MLRSLQACRAAAASIVVLFHLGGTFAQDKYFGFKALDGPFAWGDAGVDFFFVLSGFLITLLHRKDIGRPQALGGYLFKRLSRIYPTYWIVCAAVCLAALAVPSLRASLPADLAHLLPAFLLLPQDPAIVGGTGAPILFVAWSLQYELLFYAVFAAAICSRAAGAVAVVVLVAAHLDCGFNGCGFPQSFVAPPLILLFGMGVACAVAVQSRLRLRAPLLVAGLGMVAFVGFGLWDTSAGHGLLPFDRRLVFGLLSALIIFGLVRAEQTGQFSLPSRWPMLLGDASYALYLLHIPVISVLVKVLLQLGLSGPFAVIAGFCFVFVACQVIAVAFHLWIERPLLDRIQRWHRRSSQPARALPSDPAPQPTHEGLR